LRARDPIFLLQFLSCGAAQFWSAAPTVLRGHSLGGFSRVRRVAISGVPKAVAEPGYQNGACELSARGARVVGIRQSCTPGLMLKVCDILLLLQFFDCCSI
jgi:hypothetical protein